MNRKKLDQIRRQLAYVRAKSPFYRRKFKACGAVVSADDLGRLPLTSKADLLKDQERRPPFGDNLCVGLKDVVRIHKTSGTTGRPVIIAMTRKDVETTTAVGARCFRSSGLRPGDVVMHCLNYNMWAGGYTDHQSLEKAGAAVVPFGVGNTRALVETMLLLKANAIHCTPSYLPKLESVIKDRFRKRPKDLNLRLGLFGGESGLQNPEFRDSIERLWGFKAMNANYGLSEVLSMFGAECGCQNGMHFIGHDALHPELVDPRSLEPLDLAPGAVGELVLTNLEREAQPLVRYRTGDIVKILDRRCRCEENGFRFEVVGRSDDMLVIRGLNFFLGSIDSVVNRRLRDLTGVYQLLVSKADPIDKMLLKIEVRGVSRSRRATLAEAVAEEFQTRFSLKPDVSVVPAGSLFPSENKTNKLLRVL